MQGDLFYLAHHCSFALVGNILEKFDANQSQNFYKLRNVGTASTKY